ncbi:DUF2516 family protein [Yinghuangia seranimata]|uniref:DUF2516 family protein n=1 Tax=Yinghuangia seranimata TaxID=408067 RepID=UPI00248BBC3E|nr:DUF2516 family protein [Yinghuangia seranimata]MDI2131769.1 DUF2516 family protein [Yinghuangia seranimata]
MPEQTMASGALLAAFGSVTWVLFMGLMLMKLFCFVDAVTRREDAYRAADKQKKVFWVAILGISVAFDFFFGGLLSFISIASLVAAIVYLVDVRPALKQVGNGRRGGTMGPYGPW